METLAGKRALITGAAQGIGRAIARRFARAGAEGILVDRDQAGLQALAEELGAGGFPARAVVRDLSDTTRLADLVASVHAAGGPIDVLVNNAGIVAGGPFLDVALDDHLRTLRINVEALVALTHAFLPDLLSRPESHLVNLASAASYLGVPRAATYASSKWAVLGFSESLMVELRALGHGHVGVTAVCPLFVDTGMFEGARPPWGTRMLDADGVAQRVTRAVLRRERFVRTPWLAALAPMLKGVLPFGAFYGLADLMGVTASMAQWTGHHLTGRPERPRP